MCEAGWGTSSEPEVGWQGNANGGKRRREVAIQVGGSLLRVGGLGEHLSGLHQMDPPRKHSKKGSVGLGARGETGGGNASWGLPMSQHVQGVICGRWLLLPPSFSLCVAERVVTCCGVCVRLCVSVCMCHACVCAC